MHISNGFMHHGDCLSVLRDLPGESVDLVATDPPYGMSFVSNYRAEKHRPIEGDSDLGWLPELCRQVERVMRPNTAAFFFCSHHLGTFQDQISKVLKVKNLLVWEKNNTSMGDLKGDFAPKAEFCWFAAKGRPLIRGKRDPNIFKFARTQNDLHPTQKPVDLMAYLISKFSDEGDVVLDPFMGSGTTAVAAEKTGRRWVGVERDDQYHALACARVFDSVYGA